MALSLALPGSDPAQASLPKGDITKLTTGSVNAKALWVDGKGRTLAFVRDGAIFLQDVDKGGAYLLAPEGAEDPFVATSGKYVVFASDADLLGTNDDGSTEVFLYDAKDKELSQVTTTGGGRKCQNPSVDQSGKVIAFVSDADFVATNADGNREIFLYDVKAKAYTQVTSTTAGNPTSNPMLVANGKAVLFDSKADLAGTNADGNREIFRYDSKAGTFAQLTDTTTGDCQRPMPSKSGQYVAFESDSDDELAGPNDDGTNEIYLLKVSKGEFTRVTDTAVSAERPAISGNGRSVAYESSADPLATNADGSVEVFLARIESKGIDLLQVTDGAAATASDRAVLSTSASRVFFLSDAALTDDETGVDQVFVYVR